MGAPVRFVARRSCVAPQTVYMLTPRSGIFCHEVRWFRRPEEGAPPYRMGSLPKTVGHAVQGLACRNTRSSVFLLWRSTSSLLMGVGTPKKMRGLLGPHTCVLSPSSIVYFHEVDMSSRRCYTLVGVGSPHECVDKLRSQKSQL